MSKFVFEKMAAVINAILINAAAPYSGYITNEKGQENEQV